ncbi:hypothetical protein [Micromonospora echinofusca]|uniref:Uncharacterized protein n=1 Tax=Micromonospora echinofusca TaxID=47858 RepID=A0ABS3W026_MICEH|nr:hypothetical protein [Micromonospora echinofusca]MBO4210142.1 hypothetical protein [Micromonospora echinofusca]
MDLDVDYGAFPVWTRFMLPARPGRPAREVDGCAGPEALGLSAGLAADLQAWADWQDRHQPAAWRGPDGCAEPATGQDWQRWRTTGQELAHRLAAETGAAVVCLWPSEGRDPHCPHCGDPGSSGRPG